MKIGEVKIISKVIGNKRTLGWTCEIGYKTYGGFIEIEDSWDAIKDGIPEMIKQIEECMARQEEQNDN